MLTVAQFKKALIVYRNFAICEDVCNGKVLKEIGEEWGISQERIRQVVFKMARICLSRSGKTKEDFFQSYIGPIPEYTITPRNIREYNINSKFWLSKFEILKKQWKYLRY